MDLISVISFTEQCSQLFALFMWLFFNKRQIALAKLRHFEEISERERERDLKKLYLKTQIDPSISDRNTKHLSLTHRAKRLVLLVICKIVLASLSKDTAVWILMH